MVRPGRHEIKAGNAPTILQVGFSVLYQPGAYSRMRYLCRPHRQRGRSASDNLQGAGRKTLAQRRQLLVIYCGCCPWVKCPNIAAAWKELTVPKAELKNLKVLYLASNFGADWADKGYPVDATAADAPRSTVLLLLWTPAFAAPAPSAGDAKLHDYARR